MAILYPDFRKRRVPQHGIEGAFFWMFNRSKQAARVRELIETQRFTPEQVSTIVREPLSRIRALMEKNNEAA